MQLTDQKYEVSTKYIEFDKTEGDYFIYFNDDESIRLSISQVIQLKNYLIKDLIERKL